jgi:hypothetical protein
LPGDSKIPIKSGKIAQTCRPTISLDLLFVDLQNCIQGQKYPELPRTSAVLMVSQGFIALPAPLMEERPEQTMETLSAFM